MPPVDAVSSKSAGELCAAVLAGGKSSRMGRNEAMLRVSGKPMITHVVEAVRYATSRVMIISNEAEAYQFLSLPIFPDAVESCGPLAGIYTALKHAETRHCLVVACDLPFLTPSLMRFLCEHGRDCDVFAFESDTDGLEPLCAVYSRACLPIIEQQLEAGEHKVSHFFSKVNTRLVRLQPGLAFYIEHVFLNVNTPDELERARMLASPD